MATAGSCGPDHAARRAVKPAVYSSNASAGPGSSNGRLQASVSVALPQVSGSKVAQASVRVKTSRFEFQLAAGGKGGKGLDQRLQRATRRAASGPLGLPPALERIFPHGIGPLHQSRLDDDLRGITSRDDEIEYAFVRYIDLDGFDPNAVLNEQLDRLPFARNIEPRLAARYLSKQALQESQEPWEPLVTEDNVEEDQDDGTWSVIMPCAGRGGYN